MLFTFFIPVFYALENGSEDNTKIEKAEQGDTTDERKPTSIIVTEEPHIEEALPSEVESLALTEEVSDDVSPTEEETVPQVEDESLLVEEDPLVDVSDEEFFPLENASEDKNDFPEEQEETEKPFEVMIMPIDSVFYIPNPPSQAEFVSSEENPEARTEENTAPLEGIPISDEEPQDNVEKIKQEEFEIFKQKIEQAKEFLNSTDPKLEPYKNNIRRYIDYAEEVLAHRKRQRIYQSEFLVFVMDGLDRISEVPFESIRENELADLFGEADTKLAQMEMASYLFV